MGVRGVLPVIVGILILGALGFSQKTDALSESSDPFAILIKTHDEILKNHSILQNDDELFVSLEANKTYAFEFRPFLISNDKSNFEYSFDVPPGAFVKINDNQWQPNLAHTTKDGTSNLLIATNNSDEKTFQVHGYVIMSKNPGNLQLKWSQNTANDDATTLKEGSSLIVWDEDTATIKTKDEVISNNSILQNDDELFVELEANKTYAFEQRVFLDSSDVPEFKYAFDIPSNATLKINNIDWEATSPSSIFQQSDFPVLVRTEKGESVLEVHGFVSTLSEGGNLQFQWSQITDDASDTIVKKGSSLVIWEQSDKSVIKSSDEALKNNAVLQNDDELFVALEANKTYEFEQRVLVVADSKIPELKYTFEIPTNATIRIGNEDWNSNTARNSIDGTTIVPFVPLGADDRYIQIHGHVETSSTPGNLQFKWSQNNAHSDNVTVRTGSSLVVYEAGNN